MVSDAEEKDKAAPAKKEPEPALSPDFFKELLKLPPCKLGKPCNGCGKCER